MTEILSILKTFFLQELAILLFIGYGLANFSRRYFFSLAIVIGAVISAYDWSLYPFEPFCDGGRDVAAETYYTSDGQAIDVPEGRSVKFVDSNGDPCKDFVNEKLMVLRSFLTFTRFNEVPRGQKEWAKAYRYVAFLLVLGFIMSTLGLKLWLFIRAWFIGTYKVSHFFPLRYIRTILLIRMIFFLHISPREKYRM